MSGGGLFASEPGGEAVLEGGEEGCACGDPGDFPDGYVYVACACGDDDGEACLERGFGGADNDVSEDGVHACGGAG